LRYIGDMTHNIRLPKNRRKLQIYQTDAALAQMGYRVTARRFDASVMLPVFTVATPDGSEVEMSLAQLQELVYGNAQ